MQFNLESTGDKYLVQACAPGQICVRGRIITDSIILTPDQIIEWPQTSLADLVTTDLDPLLALTPQVVILGSGKALIFPPAELIAHLGSRGIGCEVMDTAAACRTYNLLVHEGRNVACGLIIEPDDRNRT